MANLAIWCLFLAVVGVYVVDDHDVEIVEFQQQFNSKVCNIGESILQPITNATFLTSYFF